MSLLLLGLLSAAVPAEARLLVDSSTLSAAWINAVVEGRGPLPALAAVQAAAKTAATLYSDAEVSSWSSRARLRGLLPGVDVAVGTDLDFGLRDAGAAELTTTEGRGFTARLSARWALGELIFSDAEMRAHRESTHRRAQIDLVVDRVTDLYFERLTVLVASCVHESTALAILARRLDGAIAALTGGLEGPRNQKELTCDDRFGSRRASP